MIILIHLPFSLPTYEGSTCVAQPSVGAPTDRSCDHPQEDGGAQRARTTSTCIPLRPTGTLNIVGGTMRRIAAGGVEE
eukprot:2952996-Pyramimonas_sp.AAC.1